MFRSWFVVLLCEFGVWDLPLFEFEKAWLVIGRVLKFWSTRTVRVWNLQDEKQLQMAVYAKIFPCPKFSEHFQLPAQASINFKREWQIPNPKCMCTSVRVFEISKIWAPQFCVERYESIVMFICRLEIFRIYVRSLSMFNYSHQLWWKWPKADWKLSLLVAECPKGLSRIYILGVRFAALVWIWWRDLGGQSKSVPAIGAVIGPT